MILDFVKKQGEIAQLDICIEECAELIHACSKLKRAMKDGYKTTTTEPQARDNLGIAIAHAVNAIRGVMLLSDIDAHSVYKDTYTSDVLSTGGSALSSEENVKWSFDNAVLMDLVPNGEYRDEEPSVPIDKDFESMMISALRYAMGRKSYIVSMTIDYITPILPSLSDTTITCMFRDIDEKFNMCDALGMEQDRLAWGRFYQNLSKEKERRKKEVENG